MSLPSICGSAAAIIAVITTPVFGNTNQTASSHIGYTVNLYYKRDLALAQSAISTLYSNAVQLLKTSNFNSLTPPASSWFQYTLPQAQKNYQEAVSGNYLLVTFNEARKVNTVGGELNVKKIVVGLKRKDLASSLHTIDADGQIVSHGKYSGPLCALLMDAVNKIVNDVPDTREN